MSSLFELFPKSLPDPNRNACMTCPHATQMIMGSTAKIYCALTGKFSWDEERTNIRLCGGNPDFIPENIEAIKESAEQKAEAEELTSSGNNN